jgi:hypothetical protein
MRKTLDYPDSMVTLSPDWAKKGIIRVRQVTQR